MSNYNKATNFAVKDTLTSGDPEKVVSGAEIDNEFNSIASAVTSKADKVTSATTDNFAALDANGNLKDSGTAASDLITASDLYDLDSLKTDLDATGDAPIYAARAFVNFNGSTVTVRESKNVSSVTRDSTGNFTINFDEAMEDADFIAAGNHDESNAGAAAFRATTRTASSFSVRTEEADLLTVNPPTVEIVFFK